MNEKNIKLFICCHSKINFVPSLFIPIQCGAAINPPVPDTLSDNKGDNISSKNREYCELTAHYYVWKNIEADFYGFCHYRRFFGFSANTKYPYLVCGKINENERRFFCTKEQLDIMLSEYCVISPRSENMGMPVKEHYCSSRFHYADDLELFLSILIKDFPQISDTALEYLSQNRQYFCNMFIMDKEHFFEYCQILFLTLFKFDKLKIMHGSFQSDRTDGYLGEIFTGIYISYLKKIGKKIKEIPRIDTNCTLKKKILYNFFPPESQRRFLAKKIVKSIL